MESLLRVVAKGCRNCAAGMSGRMRRTPSGLRYRSETWKLRANLNSGKESLRVWLEEDTVLRHHSVSRSIASRSHLDQTTTSIHARIQPQSTRSDPPNLFLSFTYSNFMRRLLRPKPPQTACFYCLVPLDPPPADAKNFVCPHCSCRNRYDASGRILSDEPAMHQEDLNHASYAVRGEPSEQHTDNGQTDKKLRPKPCCTLP